MPAILALDLGSLFAIAFLLISFIGWIMNLISAQNPPPQPNRQPQRPRQRDRKVQTEIETFLQEAMGRRGPQQKKGASEGIEIIEPTPTPRPPSARRPQGALAASPAQSGTSQASASPPLARPGEGVSHRQSVASANLGTGVRSHLASHMKRRVAEQVQEHLPHAVEASIATHLGEFRADDRDTRRGVAPVARSRAALSDPAALIAELRTPSGMRKAVVLQEILTKPRALRRQ